MLQPSKSSQMSQQAEYKDIQPRTASPQTLPERRPQAASPAAGLSPSLADSQLFPSRGSATASSSDSEESDFVVRGRGTAEKGGSSQSGNPPQADTASQSQRSSFGDGGASVDIPAALTASKRQQDRSLTRSKSRSLNAGGSIGKSGDGLPHAPESLQDRLRPAGATSPVSSASSPVPRLSASKGDYTQRPELNSQAQNSGLGSSRDTTHAEPNSSRENLERGADSSSGLTTFADIESSEFAR